ncbi:MAG TPA: haloalkane dehalogenase [Acidimicrobiales bacterium]|nr:haloalkane dehalogenase [Acidimicrobiales bacterium]
MKVLRTPDERFSGLPGYPFAPHYVEVPAGDGTASLRIHHLDEGDPAAGETVVLMHGEPSWSFLYRRMVRPLTDAGFRVVVPDLVGFGRSDKLAGRSDYTYARHVEWMRSALFDALALSNVTVVGQDWGGLVGLRLVAEHPERFRRVVAANTGLPTGDTPMGEAFMSWQRFSQEAPELPVAGIVGSGCTTKLTPEVLGAYDAPFPDESYKEGARQFPILVPTSPDDPAAAANRRAWEALESFDKPFLCAYSDADPITRGADQLFLERVPGTKGQSHQTISGGGHFLQEDRGPELAAAVIDFVRANPGS